MTEMVERVARVLSALDNNPSETPLWRMYIEDARDVIEAMREPTKEMIDALNGCGGATDDIWPAMIDAALK